MDLKRGRYTAVMKLTGLALMESIPSDSFCFMQRNEIEREEVSSHIVSI